MEGTWKNDFMDGLELQLIFKTAKLLTVIHTRLCMVKWMVEFAKQVIEEKKFRRGFTHSGHIFTYYLN